MGSIGLCWLSPSLFKNFDHCAPWKSVKTSPLLAGAWPKNSNKRGSFSFSLDAFGLVCSREEQKLQACSAVVPVSGVRQPHSLQRGSSDIAAFGLWFWFLLAWLTQLGCSQQGEVRTIAFTAILLTAIPNPLSSFY